VIRLFIFLIGLGLLLVGAASNYEFIPMPIDLRSIDVSIAGAGLTLDVLLMIVGVFLILIAWIFHKLWD
jgi:hypothetical protein